MAATLLELDGSFGEGGGQVLRSSLALSLLTGKAFHLRNVRARRPKPGLQPQHLASVRAAAQIGQAQLRGGSLHSTDLVFEPGTVTGGKYHFAIGTAGATGLVLHTVYLPLALRGTTPSELTLTGGTHVRTSPIFSFLDVTWQPFLELLGLHVRLHLRRPGFYPRGGGILEASVQPGSRIKGLRLNESIPVTKAVVVSTVAGLPEDIAHRQARRASYRLRQRGLRLDVREESLPGGPGTVLSVELNSSSVPTLFFGLGARGKPAESVADEAVEQALAFLDAPPGSVDSHTADQLVLPLALAEEPSSFRVAEVTSHLLTNLAVIRRFIDRELLCHGAEGEPGAVEIR